MNAKCTTYFPNMLFIWWHYEAYQIPFDAIYVFDLDGTSHNAPFVSEQYLIGTELHNSLCYKDAPLQPA